MSRLSVLFVALLSLSSCATVEIPDFNAYVELPASKRGFGISTVSLKETVIDEKTWKEKKRRAIYLFSEDWIILKRTIRKNCIKNKCKQAIGALDSLFLALDAGANGINN